VGRPLVQPSELPDVEANPDEGGFATGDKNGRARLVGKPIERALDRQLTTAALS